MRVGGQTLDDKTGSGGAQRGTPLGCRGSEPGTCCRVCRPWLAQGWGCLSPPLIEDWALGCPVLLHGPLCRGLVLSHPRPPSAPHASARAPVPRQVCGWPPRAQRQPRSLSRGPSTAGTGRLRGITALRRGRGRTPRPGSAVPAGAWSPLDTRVLTGMAGGH